MRRCGVALAVWVAVVGLLALAVLVDPVAAAPREGSAVVGRVVDGDTVDVVWGDGEVTRVRLAGVDTPEKFGRRECFGVRSSEWVSEYLPAGRRVVVAFDPLLDRADRYGRTIAWVRRRGARAWLNTMLVRRGYAAPGYWRYGRPSRWLGLIQGQTYALNRGLGAWGVCPVARLDVNPYDGWKTGPA